MNLFESLKKFFDSIVDNYKIHTYDYAEKEFYTVTFDFLQVIKDFLENDRLENIINGLESVIQIVFLLYTVVFPNHFHTMARIENDNNCVSYWGKPRRLATATGDQSWDPDSQPVSCPKDLAYL